MVKYRKSKKAGPFRFTVSQRGISTSVGYGPLRISHGADGKTRRTVRVPGTGIYDTKVVGGQSRSTPLSSQRRPVRATGRPSAGVIFGACVGALPIWFFFHIGAWYLGVGGIIGLIIALVADAKGIKL